MLPTVTILIPVYNDSRSATLLLERLSAEAARLPCRLSVLFVDDGSTVQEAAALPGPTAAIPLVEVLCLRRNLGHQRATGTRPCSPSGSSGTMALGFWPASSMRSFRCIWCQLRGAAGWPGSRR